MADAGEIRFAVSDDILNEVNRVLLRPKFGWSQDRVDAAIRQIAGFAEHVEPKQRIDMSRKPPGQSIGPPHHEQSFSERLILVPSSLPCNLPEEVCFLTLNLMDENLAQDHKPAPRKAEPPLNQRKSRSKPAWTDVKAKLAGLDRLGLVSLIQDLYAFQKDNQTFLHTRFGLSGDILKPYKQTLERWLSPDVLRNQDTSVSKAKQAISAYRKAIGDHAGLAELMVFYCENAAGFCNEFGNPDEAYLDALLRMFEQALAVGRQLPAEDRDALMLRRLRAHHQSRPGLWHRRCYGLLA